MAVAARSRRSVALGRDPEWYRDAVIYELHVRAFQDSDGDGMGDFRGLTRRLDYLQDLGVTALWLLPFYPSPLRDDGYDIADYTGIHPAYGTLRDFRQFLDAAHQRGLRVITELVLNHTSDEHPWFQRARRAKPGTRWRDFYVWSDTPDRYRGTRVIFQDFETSNWAWDPLANAYYWHRFYSHQPDLNFDNPEVRRSMLRVVDHWLNLGVDGLRLDAVPYLFEREATNCENLPETHEFLRELRAHVDAKFEDRMLLAEANQWPEEASAYFGDGDECHMAFHFPVMPRLFMASRMEDRFPIIDILQQTPSPPDTAQWAVFLRNHDELTLEMVTDEERDYMYRVFAHDPEMRVNLGIRRRLAPLMQNHRPKIELMNGLLFSLPGTPVVYYGDEIGMGDNVYLGDRDSVRTPMQWSPDRNAGFSAANPQRLYLPVNLDPEYHYETVNVAAELDSPASLLRWMRQLIALRKRSKVFGRGSIEFLSPDNHRVLAFLRRHEDEQVLVVANLSRFAQYVELDLSEFRGLAPVELFGQTPFPTIGEWPYLLTLGPNSFYWLSLEASRTEPTTGEDDGLPAVVVDLAWPRSLEGRGTGAFETVLPAIVRNRRWFAGKARKIAHAHVDDVIPVPLAESSERVLMTLVRVEYLDGEPETYVVPLAYATGEDADRLRHDHANAVLARLRVRGGDEGIVYDAHWHPRFGTTLIQGMTRRRRFGGLGAEIATASYPPLADALADVDLDDLYVQVLRSEQSNTSILFGDRLILKTFRRLEAGMNPELEVGRYLSEHTRDLVPEVAGALEYRSRRRAGATVGIVHRYVPNESDAWTHTVGAAAQYLERAPVGSGADQRHVDAPPALPPLDLTGQQPPEMLDELLGDYLPSAEILGRRVAELHLALASGGDDPTFMPEPVNALRQRSLYQSMRNSARRSLRQLRRGLAHVPEADREDAEKVLTLEDTVLERLRGITSVTSGLRIRHHGDLHLGQVLSTGRDFVIIDFEGEPARSLAERRHRRSPLRDVAGMLRSFHYASHAAIRDLVARGASGGDERTPLALRPWAEVWAAWVSASFLQCYLQRIDGSGLLPATPDELRVSLDVHVLDKALYELAYELGSRPDWVGIPITGILAIAGSHP
ncbi:MAG TPA: maltose alpha-D-glucosyltransferase [Acidimicrobiia bacterium]|jgi:maltose alpha-D-glucosyltransferase/alpha-amylase